MIATCYLHVIIIIFKLHIIIIYYYKNLFREVASNPTKSLRYNGQKMHAKVLGHIPIVTWPLRIGILVYRLIMGCMLTIYNDQCSPQTKQKAYWEGIVWVELMATSKHLTPPQYNIKENLVLKGYWANIPSVCWGEH